MNIVNLNEELLDFLETYLCIATPRDVDLWGKTPTLFLQMIESAAEKSSNNNQEADEEEENNIVDCTLGKRLIENGDLDQNDIILWREKALSYLMEYPWLNSWVSGI